MKRNIKRNIDIFERVVNGETFAAVGWKYGLSGNRISAICHSVVRYAIQHRRLTIFYGDIRDKETFTPVVRWLKETFANHFPYQRNFEITEAILKGHDVKELSKRFGLSYGRVNTIFHDTHALLKGAGLLPNMRTKSICDIRRIHKDSMLNALQKFSELYDARDANP